jgi:glucokinase
MAVRNGLQRGIPSSLSARFITDPHSIDFRAVIEEGVEKEDTLCCDELRRWTNNVGWLIVNAVHAYSSQLIILSGGATLGAKHYLPQVQEHVNLHTFRYPPDREVPVVISDIQEHAGVLGAAMMSLHRNP